MSKTIHPLWFKENDTLYIFGFAYSIMALTGIFSFAFGAFAERIGISKSMRWGCILYSIALFLRIYPHSFILAAISGVLGGVGAGTTIVCMRSLMFQLAKHTDRVRVISWKNVVSTTSMALGSALAGGLVMLVAGKGYVHCLMLSSLFPLIALTLMPRVPKANEVLGDKTSVFNDIRIAFVEDRFLTIGLIGTSILSGLCVSLLIPYMPVIFSDHGLSVGLVGTFIAVSSILGTSMQLLAKKMHRPKRQKSVFLLSHILLSGVTLLLAANISLTMLMLVVFLRAAIGSIAIVSYEVIEYSIADKAKSSGLFFGIIQSSFLLGDMLGGGIGGALYASFGIQALIFLAVILIVFEALGLLWFYSRLQKSATQSA